MWKALKRSLARFIAENRAANEARRARQAKTQDPEDDAWYDDAMKGLPIEQEDPCAWLEPPYSVVDPKAWDRFWKDQLEHEVGDVVHWFCDDGELVDYMRAHGMTTVLCVGNGISQEGRALAWAGLDVTVLDLSPFAIETAQRAAPPVKMLAGLVGGRGHVEGGRARYVVGNLCDPSCCPGPYDVVIERKTLQLFPKDQRDSAIQAVASRVATRGIFFSHYHQGCWHPDKPRDHILEPWFRQNAWPNLDMGAPLNGRAVSLFMTTG
jgi:hypothetical protein